MIPEDNSQAYLYSELYKTKKRCVMVWGGRVAFS